MVFIIAGLFIPYRYKKKDHFKIRALLINGKEILSNPLFLGLVLIQSLIMDFFFVFAIQSTFLIQDYLGYSPRMFGNCALLIGVSVFIGTLIYKIICIKYTTINMNLSLK